jgi:hypothetical protein
MEAVLSQRPEPPAGQGLALVDAHFFVDHISVEPKSGQVIHHNLSLKAPLRKGGTSQR